MAGERLTARFSLHSQVWSRLTGKCFETATSHIQTVVTNKKEMNKTKYIFIFILAILLCGCSATYKMNRGKVIPSDFNAKINITTTAKGVMLIPCEYEGEIKNYLFDTGAQLTDIQREKLKGKIVSVRGASNRTMESGTEVLKSFMIGEIEFKNTFATNSDSKGLKEQISNFGGIIGRPIIDRANWLIDLPNNTLTISNKELSDESFFNIPIEENSTGAPYTMINIEGKLYRGIIDLGSVSMLNVPSNTKLASELMEIYDFEDQKRERYTVGGIQSIIQQICTIPSIQVGEMKFENVVVTINESSQIRIGINLFKGKSMFGAQILLSPHSG